MWWFEYIYIVEWWPRSIKLAYPSVRMFNFFVWECLRSSLIKCQAYNTVLLTIITILYTGSSGFIHLVTASLYPLIYISLFPSSSTPGYYHSTLHFYKISLKKKTDSTYTWHHAVFVFLYLAHFRLPRCASGKEPACQCRSCETQVQLPRSGRFPGGGHSSPLQYSCPENLMDRGAWGLLSMALQRVRHDWSDLAHMHTGIWLISLSRMLSRFLCPGIIDNQLQGKLLVKKKKTVIILLRFLVILLKKEEWKKN